MILRLLSYNRGTSFPLFPLSDEGKHYAAARKHPHGTLWSRSDPGAVGMIVSARDVERIASLH